MANKWRFSPALALLTSCFLLASALAAADPDLDQKMRNPDNWAAQAGDAANHRWSNLKQIDLGGSLFVFALPDSLTHTAMHGESQGD